MRYRYALFSLCLILSACGGGGSGSPAATPAPAPVPTPPVVPTPTPPVVPPVTPPVEPVVPPPVVPAPVTPAYSAGVANLHALAPFPVGAALSYTGETFSYTSSPEQQSVIKRHFSQITAGNIMKMSYLHPGLDTYNFTQADDFVKFATDNGIKVHAHAMIWHSDYQVPGFMKTFSGDKAAWLAMLKNHVQTIGTHFAGKVSSWDVVNEAILDGGGYRNSLFYQKTGADYIEQAFINAREVDKTADLYYNDYNIEADTAKMQTMTDMLDGFIARAVPVSGVGFQMHIYLDYPSASAISAAFKKIVDRKLKVKITELDIPINNLYSGAYRAGDIKKELTLELALAQKKRYCEVIKAYMDTVPPAQRGGVTVWGVTDPSSWLIPDFQKNGHTDWPLLFDGNYHDKPALLGVADGLSGKACSA